MSFNTNNDCCCNCSCEYNVIDGNSIDIDVDPCKTSIRADIVVSERKSIRIWGRIVNCNCEPVEGALIKLLKIECDCKNTYYKGVAHTISDCEGFYQFDLCDYDDCCISNYKIIVSKPVYISDDVIPVECNNCDNCNTCYSHDCCDYNNYHDNCTDIHSNCSYKSKSIYCK